MEITHALVEKRCKIKNYTPSHPGTPSPMLAVEPLIAKNFQDDFQYSTVPGAKKTLGLANILVRGTDIKKEVITFNISK